MVEAEVTETIPGLDELQGSVRGELIDASAAGYEEACRLWNGVIAKRPAVVVKCTGTADVIAAVNFAREHDLPIAIRGGGHGVAGTALCDGGVVVDLSLMSQVRVDVERQTVRAGGGAKLGDVDHEAQAFGLAVPAGVMSRTGIGGLTLHGGMGFLLRRFGLTCDNLIGADVVTADGRLLQVDREHHPDLLWALRGGGGNFGVVTSFEYQAHPVGPLVYMAITLYPPEAATEGLQVFKEVLSDAPEELMGVAIFWTAPGEEPVPEDWQGKPAFVLAACWSGPVEEGEKVTQRLRGFTDPIVDMSSPMPFEIAQSLFDPEYPDGRRYYWKSIYIYDIDDGVATTLAEHSATRPSPLSSIDVWALGGALRREPEWGSAYARRGDPFLVGFEANWDNPTDDEVNLAWARGAHGALGSFSSGGSYLNFPGFGEEGEDLLKASFDGNYARLQQVKAEYDSENLFRSNLNITTGDA